MSQPSAIRPGSDEYNEYYGRYVSLVPDGDVIESLSGGLGSLTDLLRAVPKDREGHRYQPEKWSIRELAGHVVDSERIFAYRALRFARNDATSLEGFDQDPYVANAAFDRIALGSIVDELISVRQSTILLLRHLEPEAWSRGGKASGAHVTVRALAWITAGHGLYHEQILRTRYL